MENKKAYNRALKHVVCCIIILLLFVIANMKVNALSMDSNMHINYEIQPLIKEKIMQLNPNNIFKVKNYRYDKPRVLENNIHVFIEKNKNTLMFFSKMFGFDYEFIKEDLIKRNSNEILPENNIAGLKNNKKELIVFPNIEYGISEYFIELSKNYPEKRNNTTISYNVESDYIEKLIIYYTNIYEEVDTTLALSIGAAESGYYKVKYMLQKNNVYGGMEKNGLIVYENIEIGVLKYIRLLSNNYFKQGLTNKESIGRKYCPQVNSDGTKVASSHWINLVSKAEKKYRDYTNNITINDLIEH